MNKNLQQQDFSKEREAYFKQFQGMTMQELQEEKTKLKEYIQEVEDAHDRTKPLKNEAYLRTAGRDNPKKVEEILQSQRNSLLEQSKYIPEDKRKLQHLEAFMENKRANDNDLSL